MPLAVWNGPEDRNIFEHILGKWGSGDFKLFSLLHPTINVLFDTGNKDIEFHIIADLKVINLLTGCIGGKIL